ncbi:MAG: four helix bundle protein [Patescibacteria group bacterium]
MFIFESLKVYQKSLLFIQHIYSTTKTWPKTEQFSLIDQAHRAAISITLNIAEGSSRSRKDFKHFLDIARGSCFEIVAILSIARNQQYISQQQYHLLYQELEELIRILYGLRKSLGVAKSKGFSKS